MKTYSRPTYPLTDEAKESAIYLNTLWEAGELGQQFGWRVRANGTPYFVGRQTIPTDFELPNMAHIKELTKYGLIEYTAPDPDQGISQVLLLQELRNAVNNQFLVSDYFLMLNAVGNIIIGDPVNSTIIGTGIAEGDVNITLPQIADQLTEQLGKDILETNQELRAAIDALRESNEANRQSSLGRVVSELARCMQHGANTAVVVQALFFLLPVIERFL